MEKLYRAGQVYQFHQSIWSMLDEIESKTVHNDNESDR